MKRMSELFKLPVRSTDIEWMTAMSSDEQDEAIAHAINHVDALADALESLFDAVTNKDSNYSINNQIISAAHALAAYRRAK